MTRTPSIGPAVFSSMYDWPDVGNIVMIRMVANLLHDPEGLHGTIWHLLTRAACFGAGASRRCTRADSERCRVS